MTTLDSTPDRQELRRRFHERLQTDLEYFCAKCLVIKTKEGGQIPFIWNRAQRYLHQRIEQQLARKGYVRLFILKGRQQGISTYIAARLYHNTTRRPGRSTFILSHQSATTETLFQMVNRYHSNCPEAATPRLLVSNNRRMQFENSSQYTVGTAGSGDIGRGDTNHYLHNSEVAFFENVDRLSTGLMQTVADVPGTEVYNESTANGVGGYFYNGCMEGISNPDAGFELVFIPWYWQPEYRAPRAPVFSLTEEEADLKQAYSLDDEQIQWRRNKIEYFKLSGFGERKFKQEYPFTPEEAFQSSGESLIDPDRVALARKAHIVNNTAPLILGVDPARTGDRTVIVWRRGNHWQKHEVFRDVDPMELVGRLVTRFQKHPEIVKCFIDIAEGAAVVSRLKELGWGAIAQGVSFANTPDEPDVYLNKRAEMAGRARDWFTDEAGVRIPDADDVAVDVSSIPDFKTSSRGLLQLEAKDTIKKTLGFSPDIFDAFILTFAFFVRNNAQVAAQKVKVRRVGTSELHTVNRRRSAGKPKYIRPEEDEFPIAHPDKVAPKWSRKSR